MSRAGPPAARPGREEERPARPAASTPATNEPENGARVTTIRPVAAPSQRRALGVLFLLLALAFGGIAVAAGSAGQWIIVATAAAIALWMAGLALRGLRPMR